MPRRSRRPPLGSWRDTGRDRALRGRLLEKQPSRLIVDVSGVGYDVQVPLSTYGGIGDVGAEIVLRVHTHVREEQIALFGFLTPLEQQIFERLISVNGIGPKVALAVLSGIAPADLVAAVQGNEPARLTTIPGIGRKTAERIVLELRDRLPAELQAAGQPARRSEPESAPRQSAARRC